MKRFLVFAGRHEYPDGGWDDLHGSYDTLAEARAADQKVRENIWCDWTQVVDLHTGQEVPAPEVIPHDAPDAGKSFVTPSSWKVVNHP